MSNVISFPENKRAKADDTKVKFRYKNNVVPFARPMNKQTFKFMLSDNYYPQDVDPSGWYDWYTKLMEEDDYLK